jgi:hypothetical protein
MFGNWIQIQYSMFEYKNWWPLFNFICLAIVFSFFTQIFLLFKHYSNAKNENLQVFSPKLYMSGDNFKIKLTFFSNILFDIFIFIFFSILHFATPLSLSILFVLHLSCFSDDCGGCRRVIVDSQLLLRRWYVGLRWLGGFAVEVGFVLGWSLGLCVVD